MSELDKLMYEIPKLHRVQFVRVGRHGGLQEKIELNYYDSQHTSNPRYSYTGRSIGEVVKKLHHKLKNPQCRIGCCCCHCCEDEL